LKLKGYLNYEVVIAFIDKAWIGVTGLKRILENLLNEG
jgi:hypothetical protein